MDAEFYMDSINNSHSKGTALYVKRTLPTSVIMLAMLLVLGVSAFTFYIEKNIQYAGFAFVIGSALILIYAVSEVAQQAVIVINEDGIYDRRLGVGTISWRDIESAQLYIEYGQRYLCLRVRNPEVYLSRVKGPKRQKLAESHKLGFVLFNVSVRDIDINLLDLLKTIEKKSGAKGLSTRPKS